MTKKELEKKLGKAKVKEIEAHVRKLKREMKGKSPDEIAEAVRTRYPEMPVAGIINWIGRPTR